MSWLAGIVALYLSAGLAFVDFALDLVNLRGPMATLTTRGQRAGYLCGAFLVFAFAAVFWLPLAVAAMVVGPMRDRYHAEKRNQRRPPK